MARDAWSPLSRVPSLGSPLPESPLPACAGAAVSQSEREPYGFLPGQGGDVCADAVLWRGGPGLLDRVCKVLGASTDP